MSHLFVYGTLLPGEVRWQFLAPFVDGEGELDSVAGVLSDTGQGYPAAAFAGADGSSRIVGRVFALKSGEEAAALELLDEIEGAVAGLYRRVRVTTACGVDAWAYEYGGGLELRPIDSGSWLDRHGDDLRTG